MRRNWLIAAVGVGVAAIVVAVLLVRLARDESSDVGAWASSVCASVSDWRASILALADVGGGELTAESLREKIDEAEAATDELVTELRDLGPPDLGSGDALERELDSAAERFRIEYEGLKSDAQEALDADSPAAFVQALAALAPRFQSLLTSAATLIEGLEGAAGVADEDRAELRQAFDESEECQELVSE